MFTLLGLVIIFKVGIISGVFQKKEKIFIM